MGFYPFSNVLVAPVLSAPVITGGETVSGTAAFNNLITAAGLIDVNAGTDTAGSAPVLTPAFANGTASQLSDHTRDYMVYLTCTTSGTVFTLAIGPTSTPANTLVPSSSVTAGVQYDFRLPAGWWVEWSATTAAFATQVAIGC